MRTIEKVLKTKKVKYSGRSSDFILPSISQGCSGGCRYCYSARHFPESFYKQIRISLNIDTILESVVLTDTSFVEKPNQTHEKFITWDIGCNSDFSIDMQHTDWIKIFSFFKHSDKHFATFATKFVNNRLLTFDADKKIRVRMSLMPEHIRSKFEPNTSSTIKRIRFMNELIKSGYEVHINFSPVIYTETWLEDYVELFGIIDTELDDEVKKQLKAEVIFLTHNKKLHEFNMSQGFEYEYYLYNDLQEEKTSSFGGKNLRYRKYFKSILMDKLREIMQTHLSYCEIRYIF
jgi:spore photoproduct lyase